MSRWGVLPSRLSAATLLTAGASLVLLAPALETGWVADDHLHRLLQQAEPSVRGFSSAPFDLFRFADGDPARTRQLIESGVFPWWAHPEVRIAFFRPLASLSHWLDYQLWPESPALMHLHSLAWFAAVLAVVRRLYWEIVRGRRLFLLAFAFFAFNDAHAPVAGWIANRNALISLCFGGLALLSLHRSCTASDSRTAARASWLGPAFLALSALAGEVVVSVAMYLVAYVFCLVRGSPWLRFRAIAPYLLVMVLWKSAHAALGYGVWGSGVYVDPASSPLEFLRVTVERLPVLGLSLFAGPFADLWEVYPLTLPWLRPVIAVAGWCLLLLVAVGARPLVMENRRLRFAAVGSGLSLVLSCATFPHDRMLLVPLLGAMPLVAGLVYAAHGDRWRRRGALGLLVVHGLAAPLLLPWRAAHVGDFDALVRRAQTSLPSSGELGRRRVVLVNPPIDPIAAYVTLRMGAEDEPLPEPPMWLANGHSSLRLCTLTPREVAVTPGDGYLASASERMLRHPRLSPQLGERVELEGMTVVVESLTADGRPASVRVQFPQAVHSTHYLWMQWKGRGYVPMQPPEVGSCVRLPAIDLSSLLFAELT